MNVTFDTNVFVSAFTNTEGRAFQALASITGGRDTLFISQPIIEDLLRVLADKFGRNDAELAVVTAWIGEYGRLMAPGLRLDALADEPDNRILECALAAGADAIVTGDRAMLALGEIGNTRIISLAGYFDFNSRPAE